MLAAVWYRGCGAFWLVRTTPASLRDVVPPCLHGNVLYCALKIICVTLVRQAAYPGVAVRCGLVLLARTAWFGCLMPGSCMYVRYLLLWLSSDGWCWLCCSHSLSPDVCATCMYVSASCRSARLSLPLIKSAALLITHAGFAGVAVSPAAAAPCSNSTEGSADGTKAAADPNSSSTFALGVLQLLKQELKGCGDVAKLLEGAALLAQLACVPDCSASAIQTVMIMLVNRYPKVWGFITRRDPPPRPRLHHRRPHSFRRQAMSSTRG